jgi:hypothetical protein
MLQQVEVFSKHESVNNAYVQPCVRVRIYAINDHCDFTNQLSNINRTTTTRGNR